MKLIGSKTENDFRKEVLASQEYHFSNVPKSTLKAVLDENGYPTDNAYGLHWTPDQTEGLFTVLIDGAYLLDVNIEKFDANVNPKIERQELESYAEGLSRMNQIRFLIAQELSNAKI